MRHYTLSAILAVGMTAGAYSHAQADTTLTYIINENINLVGDPPRNLLIGENIVASAIFEPLLLDFDPETGERGLYPALATEWEAIDDLRWRFQLREGVVFHNGEPFNAEAVKFSIDRHLHPDFPSTNQFRALPIEAVEIVDEYTVDIVTETPLPILPQRLTRNGAYILAPGHYADLPLDEAGTNAVGTGPYKLEEFRRDDRVIMRAHEEYWGWSENSNIDRLVVRMIPEMSTAFSELINGNADISRVSADLADSVEREEDVDLVLTSTVMRVMVAFNLNVHPALEDPRVRVALNLAVDRDALIDAFAFGQRDAKNVTLVNPPNEHPDLEPYPYDPDRARELLAEAGYPDGFRIDVMDVMIPDVFEVTSAIAQYWGQIGVEVGEVRNLEAAVMSERWAGRTLSVAGFLWSGPENTPETDMWAVHDGRQRNSTNWYRQDFINAYDELIQTVDMERRDELNRTMQEILYEDPPWVYLYRLPAPNAVNKRVQGYVPHPSLVAEVWSSIYVEE